MTPVAPMMCVSLKSHDRNYTFLASSLRWAWKWAIRTHATLLATKAIRSTNYRVKQYTIALSISKDMSQSHSMSCQTISSSTFAISSTTYPIKGCTMDIRMTMNVVNITILRSIYWNGDKEAVNVTMTHSQLLEGLKCESKWKTVEEGGVGTRSLAHNTLRGRGACWSSGMGLGRVNKLVHLHGPAHNPHKVVSA